MRIVMDILSSFIDVQSRLKLHFLEFSHIILGQSKTHQIIILHQRKEYNQLILGQVQLAYTWEQVHQSVFYQEQSKKENNFQKIQVFAWFSTIIEVQAQMLHQWKSGLQQIGSQIKIGLNRNSKFGGILGEINGVHHQKIAVFDNQVIIGGANMSKTYFLNRKDRYMQFNNCQEMSNYLNEYLQILAQNSYQILDGNKTKQGKNELDRHIKLWSMSYRPKQYKENVHQQELFLNKLDQQLEFEKSRNIATFQKFSKKSKQLVSRNMKIAEQIGTSIVQRQQVHQKEYKKRIDTARQNLFTVGRQQYVGNELELIQKVKHEGQQILQRGKIVYVFPFMHFPRIKMKQEPKVLQKMIEIANRYKHNIKISSGYLNLSEKTMKNLQKSNYNQKQAKNKLPNNVQILCSSPQANSFFQAGKFKRYIPYFYRCFQINLLKYFNKWHKFSILEFNNNQWSFHSKGIWIKQSENSYMTILGSSNFNNRSQNNDIELQMYMYSTCPQFNKRLDKEYEHMKQNCKEVKLQDLQNDQDMKITLWIKFLSKVFQKVL